MLEKPVRGILKGNWAAKYEAEKWRQKDEMLRDHEGAKLLKENGKAGRHGVSKAAARSEGEQSEDGWNIYYLHTCHQRNRESVDQFFIRCKVRTSSLSVSLL